LPIILGGIAGLVWPENPALASAAQKTGSDVGSLISAYQAAAAQPSITPPVPSSPGQK
jgi:hypothetical protein